MYGYIYLILNKVNGKTYVGKHKLYKKKWNEDGYPGSGILLKPAQEKYGIENFEKFLICYTDSEKDACEKEEFWIAHYKSLGKAEYNIAKGGSGGITHNMTEFNRNPEIIKKRVDTFKRNHPISPNKGKKCSDATKKKISDVRKSRYWSNKGYHKTPEQIENWRKSYIGRHYYTNGIINVVRFECPEGFWPGRTCVKEG